MTSKSCVNEEFFETYHWREYGFIIGDGKLNYAPEMVAELYYKINAYQNKFFLIPDYQFIVNPAYNQDRGPVHVFALRAHVEF